MVLWEVWEKIGSREDLWDKESDMRSRQKGGLRGSGRRVIMKGNRQYECHSTGDVRNSVPED